MANFSARRSWAADDYLEVELFIDDSFPDSIDEGRTQFARLFTELVADALATDGAGDDE